MTAFKTKRLIGTEVTSYGLFVASAGEPEWDDVFNNNAAAYTPAVGDVLCYDTGDSNLHKRYDEDIATCVILGVIGAIQNDETSPTPVAQITFATNATVRYAELGVDNVATAGEILDLQNDLRAKNINVETP